VGRNDPCPCGSGKKYKKCCLGKENWSSYRSILHLEEEAKISISDLIRFASYDLKLYNRFW
jgi:hypothetical protein